MVQQAIDTFSYYSFTDTGKKRKDNQDNYCLIDKGVWLAAVVCDGMGGVRGGNLASEIAVHIISEGLNQCVASPDNEILEQLVRKANSYIFSFSSSHIEYKGLGTTISMIVCDQAGYRIAHVGDSRIYKLRDGEIELVTIDHTWANELELSGFYQQPADNRSPMSHILTRSLGVKEDINIDIISSADLLKHDVFVLCSDGIHNYCKNDFISQSFDKALTDLKKFSKILVDYSLEQGGEDNLTILSLSVNVNRHELPFSRPKVTKELGRELSIDEEDIITDALKSSRKQKSHKEPSKQPSYSYFLYGAVFALLIGLYVKSIRPIENDNKANLATFSSMENNFSSVENRNKKNISEISYRKDLILKGGYKTNLEDLYLQINLKKREILLPTLSIEQENISNEERTDIKPSRPIVWENESVRVQKLKKVYEDDLQYTTFKSTTDDKKQEKYIDQSEKNQIRERIFDAQEKLKQLNLTTKEDQEKYILQLKEVASQVKFDNEILDDMIMALNSNELAYRQLREALATSSESSLVFIANRLLTFDSSIDSLITRLKLLAGNRDYYSNLIGKVSQKDELILKLSNAQREYAQAVNDLRLEAQNILAEMSKEISAFYSGVEYLRYLLSLEHSRIQRNFGYIQVLSQFDEEKRKKMTSVYTNELSELVLKYQPIEKKYSMDDESKEDLARKFEMIKKKVEES